GHTQAPHAPHGDVDRTQALIGLIVIGSVAVMRVTHQVNPTPAGILASQPLGYALDRVVDWARAHAGPDPSRPPPPVRPGTAPRPENRHRAVGRRAGPGGRPGRPARARPLRADLHEPARARSGDGLDHRPALARQAVDR